MTSLPDTSENSRRQTGELNSMDTSRIDVGLLIEQARHGQAELGRLLEYYRPFLLIVAESEIAPRLRAKCDPEDVVQQTLLDAAKTFPQFFGRTEPEFSAWLQRIHRNDLNDFFRKVLAQKRDVDREQRLYESDGSASFCWNEPAAEQTTPSQRLIRGEKALRLAHLLQELTPPQRDAVRLRHLEGRSIREVAAELDCTVVAAAGLIKRGLQGLRGKMHEESWL